jgi:hypothetical protein
MKLSFLSLLFLIVCSCILQVTATADTLDTTVQYEKIGTYTVDRLNAILTKEFAQFSGIVIP